MSLQVDTGWVASALLLWFRLGALFFFTPLFAGFKGPNVVLVILTLALSALLAMAWAKPDAAVPAHWVALVVAGVGEVVLGMALAFGVHAAFAAFGLAGQLLDLQMGFGAGAIFDPVTRGQSPVLAAALAALAVVVFFSLDAHHALVRGIAFSVAEVPPGRWGGSLSLPALVRQFGAVFTIALSLVAPVFVVLLLLETGLAMMSRVLPQMNVFFIAMPVKISLGLSLLALGAPALLPVMARAYASIFNFWSTVLR